MNKNSPSDAKSKKLIKYSESSWKVNEFEVWSGEKICKVCCLNMGRSLLMWIGREEALLSEIALGFPEKCEALATTLLGDGGSTDLAKRLAARLCRPVYVCSGLTFDRLNIPLVEKAIILEINQYPQHYL